MLNEPNAADAGSSLNPKYSGIKETLSSNIPGLDGGAIQEIVFNLDEAASRDPFPKLMTKLYTLGVTPSEIDAIEKEVTSYVDECYDKALNAEDPHP